MTTPIGALLPADEQFIHQVTETFANVQSSDFGWCDRAYGTAHAKDGSFGLHWSVGKWTNRNVLDGHAGIARGRELMIVRGNRRLQPKPFDLSVGPIRYEVLEPLKSVRVILEPNDEQPIAFDITHEAPEAPWLEDRQIQMRGYRRAKDEIRYIQVGSISGWLEYDGKRVDITPEDWYGYRDHSWGVKENIGPPPPDMPVTAEFPKGVRYRLFWCLCRLTRPNGEAYRVHLFKWEVMSPRGTQIFNETKFFEADGSTFFAASSDIDMQYDTRIRQPLGGSFICTMEDGTKRPFSIEPVGQSRTVLGAGGLYYGYKGRYQGQVMGALHVDGAHIPDTSDLAFCREAHQNRDTLVRVVDPMGGGVGWGVLNSEIVGAWPELGLGEEYWR
ncbi:MAG: hypothetical protein ACOH12_01495 [Parvibaculaceae bacterium]